MKLYEYLKQFEGLDPELEVYGYDKDESDCLETKQIFHNYAFIAGNEAFYPKFRYEHSLNFSKKVLIIS